MNCVLCTAAKRRPTCAFRQRAYDMKSSATNS